MFDLLVQPRIEVLLDEFAGRDEALFGGRACIAYDFCYHASCDDLSNIDHRTLDEMTRAASVVVLRFANSPLDLEEEGRRLLAAAAPVPAASVDQGHGPSNAAEARQPR